MQSHQDSKIVIFCHYQKTAHYLEEALTKLLPNRVCATTANKSYEELEKIITAFAPVANDTLAQSPHKENIDILIATGAMAEGFNLQDANVLINFDLPWTVLILAQRMGRILRPWHSPRSVWIYNLIPSTMSNSKIQMGMHWKNRLHGRSRDLTHFAEIPVFCESRQEDLSMAELARNLATFKEENLSTEEAIEFVSSAEGLQTSPFLHDLSFISKEEATRLTALPLGIRSARNKPNFIREKMLYVLFQVNGFPMPALFNEEGNLISEQRDEVFSTIRCAKEEPLLNYSPFWEKNEYDEWLLKAREHWQLQKNLSEPEKIICSMALA
ncbi:MAG: hypothetical protein D6767_01310 [Candidatus Hydrogenedentota bacterium]|nr:MAG: hypothetical protein D6767_01310 [Candidatus Hydrogenedentota bacterium]